MPELNVNDARGEFIVSKYDEIFGEEDMGDAAVEMTPSDLTGILVAYESHLAAKGLLKAVTEEK